jgi:DeoR family transcriptional regulator, suf operon transcriptional repressor
MQMSSVTVNSDSDLLELLRVAGSLEVSQLADAIEVTPTAVRLRLGRMMAKGFIDREPIRHGRGRPRHRYRLTDRGLELTGSNFTDLAITLWREISSIVNPDLRRELLRRVAKGLARGYIGQVTGTTIEERMRSLAELLAERRVPFAVSEVGKGLPVLYAKACPYPKLAEDDRSVCAMEQILFSELLGREVELKCCRLDGGGDCQFEAK